jgi:hypothetical protein
VNGSVNGSMNGPARGRSSSVACIGACGHEGSFVLVSDGGVASSCDVSSKESGSLIGPAVKSAGPTVAIISLGSRDVSSCGLPGTIISVGAVILAQVNHSF